jgi:hypothetical protein
MIVYYVDGEKFTTENYDEISIRKISSPNENTPAWENLKTGEKLWMKKGFVRHRLTGPAEITSDGREEFWLYKKYYENVKDWINNHPNPDLYFNAIGILTETDIVLWDLKN